MSLNEAAIRLLSCPPAIQQEIIRYAAGLADLLGDRLPALYLYGSLARGCFHEQTSDVDTIALLSEPASEHEMAEILTVHQQTTIPVDALFVTESQACLNIFPAPIAFLVKPMDGGKIVIPRDGSRDFLLQRQDAWEAGVALCGPPPGEVLQPVPWPVLEMSLEYLCPYIVTHFKNPVLMLCRIAHAFTFRRLCGKAQAGIWATSAFDLRWNTLINEALTDYRQGVRRQLCRETLSAFEQYCMEFILRTRDC
ncbi:MAG TPA: nucleotidyltransferase domain-containing protein [Armatimonadota bacterium]|jgi:predicted nucleotidyltransferase